MLVASAAGLLAALAAIAVITEPARRAPDQVAGPGDDGGRRHGAGEGARAPVRGEGEATPPEEPPIGEAPPPEEPIGEATPPEQPVVDEGAGALAAFRDRVRLSPERIRAAGMEILTARPGTILVTVTLPGEVALDAEAVARVAPRVPGTAREVKKQLGDRVKRGEVLAVLDSPELARLQREHVAAKERLTRALASLAREEAPGKEQRSTEEAHVAAKLAVDDARLEERRAAQKLDDVAGDGAARGSKGSRYVLVAPLGGTIIEGHVVAGDVLGEGTPAFVIADLSALRVDATVGAADLVRLRIGQPAWVKAEAIDRIAQGTLAYLGEAAGEQGRPAVARVALDNPGAAWRPGLPATTSVLIEEAVALVIVSADALQRIDGKEVVFVEEGDSFMARRVKVGRRGTSTTRGAEGEGRRPGAPAVDPQRGAPVVEIEAGMAPGERYVARNSALLKAELGKPEAGDRRPGPVTP